MSSSGGSQKQDYVLTMDGENTAPGAGARVSAIRLHSRVDEPAEMRVQLAYGAKEAVALEPASFAEKAALRVYDRGVFRGTLVDVHRLEAGLVELVYVDAVFKIARLTESDFFKGLSLESYLKRVATMTGLTPRFHGAFSSVLPAFNVTGTSILDHVQKISYPYGFHFCARSYASEILFLRLERYGDGHDLSALDTSQKIVSAQSHHDSRQMYKSAEVRFFDSSTQKSDKKELSIEKIYAPLGYLKQSPSFQRRSKRTVPAGREEQLATQAKVFGETDEMVGNELSKRALAQEVLGLECWSLPALPGDRLSVSKMPDTDADGKYFVKGMSIEIQSHRPLVKLNLNRA